MSTPKKTSSPTVNGSKRSVPPAPTTNGEPASFAPKPKNVPVPEVQDAVVVGTGSAAEGGKKGVAQGKLMPDTQQKQAPGSIGARRVRLAVTKIDPWSAMKMSFLLSIAAGIMMVIAVIVFWNVLDSLQVFTMIDSIIKEILGENAQVNVLQYVDLSRVVSLTTIIAVIDVVLLTALGTIGAFLYNVVAALVGGIHLTLTDD